MNNYTFKNRDGINYRRVDKRQARKAFNNYIDVVLCPVNMRPFNDYCPVSIVLSHKLMDELENEKSFDYMVNEYAFYHCTGTQKNKVAFYVAID